MDSVEISLLTCEPHSAVYSLYGHTAIRYHEMSEGGMDAAFNYGVFDFRKSFFVARFVLGWTDYELGVYPFAAFAAEYRHRGSLVTEQVLNLTSSEKLKLKQALGENLQDGNRIYRYNFYYNNCTTKARDIIEKCIEGKMIYETQEDLHPTWRQMVHEMTQNHPWAAFGNDILLGVRSDMPTDQRQQQFLPYNLMHDFNNARIYSNGQYRPLVKESRVAVPGGVHIVEQEFPLTPTWVGILISIFAVVLFAWQWKRRQSFLWWDVTIMTMTGTIGLLLFVMVFSQHPTTSINLQILAFNPLPWGFLYQVVRRRKTCYWHLVCALVILFFIGGFWQDYAEGIYSLALCLLLQSIIHMKNVNSEK